ncbi:hypothetical protein O1L60_25380 [Streptomyces diastatochromogenes]|nr:hypothetical protein [Streptomyces diastatochromogenes]
MTASARGGQGTGSAVTRCAPPPRRRRHGRGVRTRHAVRRAYGRPVRRRGRALHRGHPGRRPAGPVAPAAQGTVPSGAVPPDEVHSAASPLVAVRLRNPAPQSLLALSPFIRPTAPALQLAFAPGPSPMASPTTAPLGSHR